MIRTCGVFLRRSFAGWLRRWYGSTTRGVPSRAASGSLRIGRWFSFSITRTGSSIRLSCGWRPDGPRASSPRARYLQTRSGGWRWTPSAASPSTARTSPGARRRRCATSRNDDSFARCRAELAAGGALALFPEGVSHSDPQLRPLKTGAARIALSAEAEHDGKLGVTIVPVGLYYERKTMFRSSVLLAVGEPLAVAPLLADYRRDERAAVTALTETIDARLDEVVLQAETRELLIGIARVADWTRERDAEPDALAPQHRRALAMLGARISGCARAIRSGWRRSPPTHARTRARCAGWACAIRGRWSWCRFARARWRRRWASWSSPRRSRRSAR